MRLYIDEDTMQKALLNALRVRGVDCLTADDAGMRSRSDLEQLEWATADGRVIYSANVGDFCRLNAEWAHIGRRHTGIIVNADKYLPVGQQLRAIEAIAAKEGDDLSGRLFFLLNYV